jgi:hypothetical protein
MHHGLVLGHPITPSTMEHLRAPKPMGGHMAIR